MTNVFTSLHRPAGVSIMLVTTTIAIGLLVRFGPLGLPRFVVKYGGSTLWALMIYWIVSTLLPRWRLASVASLAGGIATSIELTKLYHSLSLDAFRLTVPGMLLLGRAFSVWDILAYWLAVAIGAVLDSSIRRIGRLEAL